MKRIVLLFITLFVLTCALSSCNSLTAICESRGEYTQEEVLEVYNNNKNDFIEMCHILISNGDFYDNRNVNSSSYSAIFHFNDKPKKFFKEEDWLIISNFFVKTKPYEISLRNEKVVQFVYIDNQKEGSFSFYYFEDSNIGELSYYSQEYNKFNQIDDNWYWGYRTA